MLMRFTLDPAHLQYKSQKTGPRTCALLRAQESVQDYRAGGGGARAPARAAAVGEGGVAVPGEAISAHGLRPQPPDSEPARVLRSVCHGKRSMVMERPTSATIKVS